MWNSFQVQSNMGLQMLPMSNKRTRDERLLDDEEEDDSPIPTKIGKSDDNLWEEYYPAGKCYQCTEAGTSSPPYYAPPPPPPSCDPYPAQCWTPPPPGCHTCVSSSCANTPNNKFQPVAQQTIRCDENGKSYLDLGSGTAVPRCRNPRTKWCACGPSCYRQRRLTVLNISMCKLGRYRQFTDPSLYRSVLICNTLRYIEREMEHEGCFAQQAIEAPPEPARPPTPYPHEDADSGIGEDSRSINWGSVLSLSSQSDLDPLNNNESELEFGQFDECRLSELSVDEMLKTPTQKEPDIENIMQVLRFTA